MSGRPVINRRSAFDGSFNEPHVLAITQTICDYRRAHDIGGPVFLGLDTHALSEPACASGLEVLAASGVTVMLATNDEDTPTPTISHAILTFDRGRSAGFADGIVITPSHNPPRDGGHKYNRPNGGPADRKITAWIEATANRYLEAQLLGIKRTAYTKALRAGTTYRHDYVAAYVADLRSMIDMQVIRDVVDSRFAFMTLDWDGQIRMAPSSPYAKQRLIDIEDHFQIAFACDTDHDRHGIVTPAIGLLPPNHYLSVAIDYLFRHWRQWGAHAAIGKTVVCTGLIDRVASKLKRRLYEVPVGFKWFSAGLLDGSLGFGGEEGAGATFLRCDGSNHRPI